MTPENTVIFAAATLAPEQLQIWYQYKDRDLQDSWDTWAIAWGRPYLDNEASFNFLCLPMGVDPNDS